MCQFNFFSQKSNCSPKEYNPTTFYIPVVEMINEIQQFRAWNYARNPRVSRLFYASLEDLFAQEGIEAKRAGVYCYKVALNSSQLEALEQSKSIGKAYLMALSFKPQDILSCIKITKDEQLEVFNPFYQIKEANEVRNSL